MGRVMTDEVAKLIKAFGKARAAYKPGGHCDLRAELVRARAALLAVACATSDPPELAAFFVATVNAEDGYAGSLRAARDAEDALAAYGQNLAAGDWMADLATDLRTSAATVEGYAERGVMEKSYAYPIATTMRKAANVLLEKHRGKK